MSKKYKCQWCGFEFSCQVEYSAPQRNVKTGQSIPNRGKKSAVSTQVRCPDCQRLIPTWKRESTDNLAGRKHIHIRN
jgi:DNA-directed RNA polymerase subunit RPC12/RpoP